jgi:hypothetical protein
VVSRQTSLFDHSSVPATPKSILHNTISIMREIKKYVRFYVQKRNSWKDQSLDRPRNIVMLFNYDGKRLCTLLYKWFKTKLFSVAISNIDLVSEERSATLGNFKSKILCRII